MLSSLPMCSKIIIYGLVKIFVRPLFIFWIIFLFIRFGTKLYIQIIDIPMGTNFAPFVADLFLFCYERYFMKSLSPENQADITEAFNSTSRYLDDLLNIDNIYFEQMVNRIYPAELLLNKANSSDTEAPFLDLNLSISKFPLKFMINGTILILLISRFLMETALDVHHMAFTYLSLFGSLEHLLTKRLQLSEQSPNFQTP